MATAERAPAGSEVDLAVTPLRELNAAPARAPRRRSGRWRVLNPRGAHALAVGIDAPLEVEIEGHAGYYCAGMNKHATVRVHGNSGVGVAENMMSGTVVVDGSASQSAGATGRGGLLVVRGSAAARCGISMKGIDIVVCGSVGHMSAFMAQKGCLVVCGDAGEALGDSIYEAHVYVGDRLRGWAPIASRRRCASTTWPSWRACSSAARSRAASRRTFAATEPLAGSTTSTSTTRASTDAPVRASPAPPRR